MPERLLLRIETLLNDVELVTDENGHIRWLPEPEKMAFAGAGAGGMRSFGRIALWSSSKTGGGLYLQRLREKIQQLYQDLNNQGTGIEPVAYLAGTFTGGTNSGMFLDVAYLCRDVMDPSHAMNPPILGLFLLPPVDSNDVKSVSNAYACLKDLDHFTQEDSQFLARWPLNVAVDLFPQGKSPFKLTSLMSLSWVPDGDIKSLYRVAGLFLYLMGAGFMPYRKARIIDVAAAGENVWKFSAIGMTCLFFPRGEIRVCAAGDVAIERLVDTWNDAKKCRGLKLADHLTIDQVFGDRRLKYRTLVDDTMEEAFTLLNQRGPNAKAVTTAIRGFLQRVTKKEARFDRDTLNSFLGRDGELFAAAQASAISAIEVVEQKLGAAIIEEIEDTENLAYGARLIHEICDYLDETLNFWEKLRIANWDSALEGNVDDEAPDDLVSDLLIDQAQLLGQGQAVRLSRLSEVLRKMHMSVMLSPLRGLVSYLKTGAIQGGPEEQRSIDPNLVPCIASIDALRGLVSETGEAIRQTQAGVRDGVRPNDLIKYTFAHDNFETDVQAAKSGFDTTYSPDSGARSRSADLLQYGHEGRIWTQLMHFHEASRTMDSPPSMAEWIIDRVSSQLKSRQLPSFGDGSIYTNSNLPVLASTAKTNVSLNLGVANTQLSNAPTHPKVVVTQSGANQEQVDRHLKSHREEDFQSPADASADDLADMVLFFDERPVRTLADLARIQQWQPQYNLRRENDSSVDCYIHTLAP